MILAVILIILVLIVVFEFVPLIKTKKKNEYITYGIILAVCSVLLILIALEFYMPNEISLVEMVSGVMGFG